MDAEVMVDTDIVVYAASRVPEDADKAAVASDILFNQDVGLSTQVLQEFPVVSTRKVRKPWRLDEAIEWIRELDRFPCVPIDAAMVRQGAEMAIRHRLSCWDGALIAAAHRLCASVVYSEDLSHGQFYGSVQVINPFRPS